MKICKDCKHHKPGKHINDDRCTRKDRVGHGRGVEYCDIERYFGWLDCRLNGTCGKGARFWEAK